MGRTLERPLFYRHAVGSNGEGHPYLVPGVCRIPLITLAPLDPAAQEVGWRPDDPALECRSGPLELRWSAGICWDPADSKLATNQGGVCCDVMR